MNDFFSSLVVSMNERASEREREKSLASERTNHLERKYTVNLGIYKHISTAWDNVQMSEDQKVSNGDGERERERESKWAK